MSSVFYGADGRFYNISASGIAVSGEGPQAPSSLSILASAGMLAVDDMAAAAPTIFYHP